MVLMLVGAGRDLFIVVCCSSVLDVDQFSFAQEGRVVSIVIEVFVDVIVAKLFLQDMYTKLLESDARAFNSTTRTSDIRVLYQYSIFMFLCLDRLQIQRVGYVPFQTIERKA